MSAGAVHTKFCVVLPPLIFPITVKIWWSQLLKAIYPLWNLLRTIVTCRTYHICYSNGSRKVLVFVSQYTKTAYLPHNLALITFASKLLELPHTSFSDISRVCMFHISLQFYSFHFVADISEFNNVTVSPIYCLVFYQHNLL